MRKGYEIAGIVIVIIALVLVIVGIFSAIRHQYQNIPEGTNLTGPVFSVQDLISLGIFSFIVAVLLLFFFGFEDGNGGAWEPPPGGVHL